MMNGWGFTGGRMPQRFEEQYHCYSVAYADKPHLEVRLWKDVGRLLCVQFNSNQLLLIHFVTNRCFPFLFSIAIRLLTLVLMLIYYFTID